MKFIAVIMLVAAAGFFTVGEPEAFIPGAAFFTSGLWLLTRRRQEPLPVASPETDTRLRALESDVLLLSQELARTKEDLEELTDERDFLRQLYPGATRDQSAMRDHFAVGDQSAMRDHSAMGSKTSKMVGSPSA